MLVDTHSHLNFNAFKDDANEVIRRSLDGSTGSPQVWIINVGSQYSTSKRAVEIAEKYPAGVFAAVGLHPIHVSLEDFEPAKYKELIRNNKVAAIGEIGLDYKAEYILFKEKQKEVFRDQLKLAEESNLPVIFHCRMAHDDLIKEIRSRNEIGSPKITGVIHCFTGTWEQAKKYLEFGFYLGFNGIIFKLNLDEIIKKTPLERILIETDCPYLTPPPASLRERSEALRAGPIRNEPIFVKYVVQKIAELKGETFEKVAKITTQNAKELFRI